MRIRIIKMAELQIVPGRPRYFNDHQYPSSNMAEKADNRKSWNLISDFYQRRHKISTRYAHYGPSAPNENDLKLLGEVRGKKILEIGCGGGQNAIAFAKQGAIATGIDQSDKQIEFAKKLAEKEGTEVRFIRGDMTDMKEIERGSQDFVYTAVSLCFTPIEKTFKEVYRVLKPGGRFVFSDIHPFYDVFSEDDFTLQNSYFRSGYHEWNWGYTEKDEPKNTRCFGYYYKVSDLTNTLIDCGFRIEEILEPEPVEKDEVADYTKDYPLERLKMIPGTIIFVARKE
jgi:ubiquinone/menaquinone biosynthesis C-methylase UbiE